MSDVGACVYCKSGLDAGATKCHACGEWVNGRWRLSGAGKVCLGLIAAETLAMVAMSWSWVPSMRAMLADFGGPTPAFTRVVLSSWWLPAWTAIVIVGVVSSFAFTIRTRRRLTLLASALAIGLIAVVVTWWGLQQPISDLAGSIQAE
jgi:hypothetical protein